MASEFSFLRRVGEQIATLRQALKAIAGGAAQDPKAAAAEALRQAGPWEPEDTSGATQAAAPDRLLGLVESLEAAAISYGGAPASCEPAARETLKQARDAVDAALGAAPSQALSKPVHRLIDAARAVLDHRYQMGAPTLPVHNELEDAIRNVGLLESSRNKPALAHGALASQEDTMGVVGADGQKHHLFRTRAEEDVAVARSPLTVASSLIALAERVGAVLPARQPCADGGDQQQERTDGR